MQTNIRLEKIRKSLKLTKSVFAESIGLSAGGYSDIISGRNKGISKPVIKAIEYCYKVNPTWLLTGEGEMFLGRSGNSNIGNNYGNGSIGNITINSNNSHTQTVVLTDEELELVKSYREKQFKQIMKKIANMLCFWR